MFGQFTVGLHSWALLNTRRPDLYIRCLKFFIVVLSNINIRNLTQALTNMKVTTFYIDFTILFYVIYLLEFCSIIPSK